MLLISKYIVRRTHFVQYYGKVSLYTISVMYFIHLYTSIIHQRREHSIIRILKHNAHILVFSLVSFFQLTYIQQISFLSFSTCITRLFHDFLTLLTSTEKLLTRTWFEYALSGTPVRRSTCWATKTLGTVYSFNPI